jgi:hypothetical protein
VRILKTVRKAANFSGAAEPAMFLVRRDASHTQQCGGRWFPACVRITCASPVNPSSSSSCGSILNEVLVSSRRPYTAPQRIGRRFSLLAAVGMRETCRRILLGGDQAVLLTARGGAFFTSLSNIESDCPLPLTRRVRPSIDITLHV